MKVNAGCIDAAIRNLIAERDKTWSDNISKSYEWNIKVHLSDDIGFEFMVTDLVFQNMDNNNVQYEEQVQILLNFIYQLIEIDLMKDSNSIESKLVH